MSRFLTACVTALIIGFSSTSGISAQERELTAPVDIRPSASRMPTRSKPQPGAAVQPDHPMPNAGHASVAKPRKASRKRVKKVHVAQPKPEAAKAVAVASEDAAKKDAATSGSAKVAPSSAELTDKGGAVAKDETPTASTTPKPSAAVMAMPADFCSNIADVAAETRAKVRADQLAALEADLRTRISELEAKKAEVQSWVERQEDLRKRADESVLAILSKMKAESAAAQIALMDDQTAAAVLMKLGPKVASSILNDMGATKAARITESMMTSRVASRNDGAKSAN